MNQYVNIKIPTDSEISKGFKNYLIGFIFERIFFIIVKLSIIGAVFGLLYLGLKLSNQESSIIKNSFLIPSIIYPLLAIWRIRTLWPINIFTSVNFDSGFQEAATSNIDGFNGYRGYGSNIGGSIFHNKSYSRADEDYGGNEFIFKIVKAPGDALGDIIVLVIQIIGVIFFSQKYLPYLKILAKQNGNAITGNEILTHINQNNYKINEIQCRELLNKMINFEWVIKSNFGYKLTSNIRRKLDKNFRD